MGGSWGIRLRMRVVLPEPRKPVRMVMGVGGVVDAMIGTIVAGKDGKKRQCRGFVEYLFLTASETCTC